MRPLHHIHARPVVLQEIEIDRGEVAQLMAQIAHARNRFQKHLRHHHGRARIDVNAAVVQRRDQRAEQPEIVMRGAAERCRRSTAGCVCGVSVPMATCTVTGTRARHACSSRLARRMRGRRESVERARPALRPRPCPPRSAAIPFAAGFFRRAEAPVRQHRFHVFAGLARRARFRNRGWRPSRSSRTPVAKPRRIRSISTGARPHLITCPPMPQMIAASAFARAADRIDHSAKRIARQDVRQASRASPRRRTRSDKAARNRPICTLPPRSRRRTVFKPGEIDAARSA